jgi:phosphoadenosine phosphosulfate reductase
MIRTTGITSPDPQVSILKISTMSQQLKHEIGILMQQTEDFEIPQVLQLLTERFPKAVTFSTSFSNEDQAIAHLIAQSGADVSVFTLDTGRLFQSTHTLWQETITALGLEIKAYYPAPEEIQQYTKSNGPNAFYNSKELRQRCCEIRKVLPLQKALAGMSVWITGMRTEHSEDRSKVSLFEWDQRNKVIKYNPLLDWTSEEVTAYISKYHLPFNPLTEKGFVSIGCEPCTRAIKPGESFRAGRWWWEDGDKKECGLHNHSNTNHQ